MNKLSQNKDLTINEKIELLLQEDLCIEFLLFSRDNYKMQLGFILNKFFDYKNR